MVKALKIIAAAAFAISALGVLLASFALLSDSASSGAMNAAVLGGTVTSLLLSGAVWLLSDIAQSMRERR